VLIAGANAIMNCKDCLPLISSYVDDELSEPQAAPLRQHLMDCPACRRALQGERSFKRWFEPRPEPVAVPEGFAARVARRAFAGDEGSGAGWDSAVAEDASRAGETPVLQFVLRATAVAAGLLLVLSISIFSTRLPDGGNVHGQRVNDKEDVLEALDALKDPAGGPEALDGPSALRDMAEAPGADSEPGGPGDEALRKEAPKER